MLYMSSIGRSFSDMIVEVAVCCTRNGVERRVGREPCQLFTSKRLFVKPDVVGSP